MLQDFSSEHVPEQRRGFVNSCCPFKSENVPIEWLRVLLGLCQFHVQLAGQWIAYLWYQPLTTTAYSLRVLRPLAGRFRQDTALLRAAVTVDTFTTPAGVYRDPEPRKRCEHGR